MHKTKLGCCVYFKLRHFRFAGSCSTVTGTLTGGSCSATSPGTTVKPSVTWSWPLTLTGWVTMATDYTWWILTSTITWIMRTRLRTTCKRTRGRNSRKTLVQNQRKLILFFWSGLKVVQHTLLWQRFFRKTLLPFVRTAYIKRNRQCWDNSVMMPGILFSLKIIELLQNGVATYFQATPLFSMRTESPGSSLSSRSIDTDAWCTQGLRLLIKFSKIGLTDFLLSLDKENNDGCCHSCNLSSTRACLFGKVQKLVNSAVVWLPVNVVP